MATAGDNEKQIDRLWDALKGCVAEGLCSERHGNVMSALEGLSDTTKDLADVTSELKDAIAEETQARQSDQLKISRAEKRWLVSLLVSVGLVVLALILNHLTGKK